MIQDKTGKRVRQGQLVDVKLDGRFTVDGMYTCDIVGVEEPSHLQPRQPGYVVLRCMLKIAVGPDGKIPAYIVREALASGPQAVPPLPPATPEEPENKPS